MRSPSVHTARTEGLCTSEAVYVGMLWSRPLMSRDRPKSDTLQTRLELTNTFLAARSRWTKFLSERYRIPAPMPLSIPTSCRTLNWPSFSWKSLSVQRVSGEGGLGLWWRQTGNRLTLRKESRGPFSMNSVMILSGGLRVITPSSFSTLGWSNCPRTPASLRNIPFSLSDAPQRRVFTATSTSLRPSGR